MVRKPAECKLHCCTTPAEAVERIRESLARWTPGGWAEKVSPGPTCSCGVAGSKVPCHMHPAGPKDEPFSMFTE